MRHDNLGAGEGWSIGGNHRRGKSWMRLVSSLMTKTGGRTTFPMVSQNQEEVVWPLKRRYHHLLWTKQWRLQAIAQEPSDGCERTVRWHRGGWERRNRLGLLIQRAYARSDGGQGSRGWPLILRGGKGERFPGGISLCQVVAADRPNEFVMDRGGVLLCHEEELRRWEDYRSLDWDPWWSDDEDQCGELPLASQEKWGWIPWAYSLGTPVGRWAEADFWSSLCRGCQVWSPLEYKP